MSHWLGIRHAQSTWNALGRWQGQADPPLSETGRGQAAVLARELESAGLVRVVASDLARARETAEIAAAHLGLPLEIDPGLREWDVGAWSGLTHPEIARRWPETYARVWEGDPTVQPEGGESRRAFAARVHAALAALRARLGAAPVALVTHGGVLRTWVSGARPGNAEILTLEVEPRASAAPWPAEPAGDAWEGEVR